MKLIKNIQVYAPKDLGVKDVLISENLLFYFIKLVCVFIINKKSYQIENPGKITYHKNNVNRFDNGIQHREFFCKDTFY